MKIRLAVWLPLVGLSLLTQLAFQTLWMNSRYTEILIVLGILTVFSSVLVFRYYGLRFWPTMAVIICLVIGQLWAVEFVFAWVAWSRHGFAP
jgi:hypothetical protein